MNPQHTVVWLIWEEHGNLAMVMLLLLLTSGHPPPRPSQGQLPAGL
jgi:hypothetical protein